MKSQSVAIQMKGAEQYSLKHPFGHDTESIFCSEALPSYKNDISTVKLAFKSTFLWAAVNKR